MADAALEVRGLRFAYDGGANGWTVEVAHLAVARGEQVLLRGGSGVGKSTLLHLIAGLLDPQEGEIEVAGTVVGSLRGAARDRFRGRTIGMIFQTFHLLPGFTALENVMMALKFSAVPRGEHRARARALLERLGIGRMDAPAEELSVGQQQRVAVARAVAAHPVLVLADEPTASLDPENAAGAVELIREVCREQGAALVCVSHDPSMGEHFERRVRFESLRAGGG